MKFKKYLNEIKDNSNVDIDDPMSKIKIILSSMSDDELNEFGDWLEDNLSSEDKNTDIDDIDMDDDMDEYSLNDIIEIIQSLSSDDLDYILFMLQDQADPDDVDDADNVVPDTTVNNESLNAIDNVDKRIKNIFKNILDESVVARFKASNRNHAKKRFQLTRSQLKAGRAERKINNIKNRAKKKAYYRKNKVKIKKYNKSYINAVKSGQHLKKIRR